MIQLFVFTEEESARIFFETLLPKVVPEDVSFRVFSHQGKNDLLNGLKKTIPTISKIPGARILVTQDQDFNSCVDVKKSIDEILSKSCKCAYKIRIVCQELESWFLGDLNAIKLAYPRFNSSKVKNNAIKKNVDLIKKPNVLLLRNIPEFSGHEKLPKVECARNISKYMSLADNKSTSFQYTIDAIKTLSIKSNAQ